MTKATLIRGPAMALARSGQATARLADGRVLIIGGTVPFKGTCEMACMAPPTASVEIFDPRTGKFRSGGSLVEPRTGADALQLDDGRVLVYGGLFVNTLEIYDPARGRSMKVKVPADIPNLPQNPTVVMLRDGRVLIAGGTYDNEQSSSDVTWIFDPVTGAFSRGPRLGKPREDAAATLLTDGRVLIAGGQSFFEYAGNPNDDAEVIDLSRPLAASIQLSPAGDAGLGPETAMAPLSDGRVLVTGGGVYDTSAGCLMPGGTQVFDPAAESFASAGRMTTPRSSSKTVAIKDGRVLVFGGTDRSCAGISTIEAFDTESGTFQVVATGFPVLNGFSLTPLADGRVLIAGGDNGGWNGMTSATWLLAP